MKVSLNWIKQYLDFELPPVDELVEKIGAQLGAVEEVENLGEKYQGIIIAKVVACQKHEDSDHLNVCKIDDGGAAKDVERDENGLVQVVCGAANVREGLLVAWLPPGSTVPESVGKDPFVLGKRELRGVVSNGMLASPRELALGDNHEGILEIDPDEWSPNQTGINPGADFATVFGLNDYIIDIENKMFTHRPDCFGQLGVAREIAGILGHQFKSPKWYLQSVIPTEVEESSQKNKEDLSTPPNGSAQDDAGEGLELEVFNDNPDKIPRFMAVVIKGVEIKPSPLWLQIELVRVGAKPINNVVDVTNYIMLLTAQPTHAYDYDKLPNHELGARLARKGETVALLNHKTYQLNEDDIVIASGKGPVGLAGIMGGSNSEVSADTKNIVLEVATFDMYTVRKSSMRHGVFTDALTRFNKGQSPLQNAYVLGLLMQSIADVAGGKIASPVKDTSELQDRLWVHPPVPVTAEFINARLGLKISAGEMKTLLENVECTVGVDGESLTVTAPFWRTDIETREDVVEEVGRLYGFDKLPLELPKRSIKPAEKDAMLELKSSVREILSKAGANEVLTYSFVHGDLLTKTGQNPEHAFRVGNALSPDLQYYRLSLTPSLLDKVHMNIKAGYDEFALFEMGKGHNLKHVDDDESLPMEFDMLDLVYAHSDRTRKPGAAFYEARKFLSSLAAEFGMKLEFRPIEKEEDYPVVKPYDHTRAAQVWAGEVPLGMVGEYKAGVRKALKLPVHSAGFGIGLMQLQQAIMHTKGNGYVALPRFPKVTQDITLKMLADVPYQTLYDFVWNELAKVQPDQTLPSLEPIDIYQREDDTEHKQITLRLTIASYEKTMTDTEVSKLLDAVAGAAQAKFGAIRI